MSLHISTRILALALSAPVVASIPLAMSQRASSLSATEAAELRASVDRSLDGLRAGRADNAAPLSASVRADLAAATDRGAALAEWRGGFAPTNNEWTWLAIGAGIVLLIVLL